MYRTHDVDVQDAPYVLEGRLLERREDRYGGVVHHTSSDPKRSIARSARASTAAASVVGHVPQPYTHAYVMSKAAIRILSGSLRQGSADGDFGGRRRTRFRRAVGAAALTGAGAAASRAVSAPAAGRDHTENR